MKRILYLAFFLPLFFSSLAVCAQSAHDNDQAYIKVRKYFDDQNAAAVYDMTAESFRKHVSKEMFLSIAQNNLFPLGKIQEAEMLNYKDGISSYKVVYTNATLEMIIGLDKDGKIDALAFRPYKAPVADKAYTVATSNTYSKFTTSPNFSKIKQRC